MAYSDVGIVNLALTRIGVKRIAALSGTDPTSLDCNAIWEYIRDEVLEARDWKFCKTRAGLAKSATSPLYTWEYAYTLPALFLRLARGTKNDPNFYPDTVDTITYPYVIEALPDGTPCLMTNYDNHRDAGEIGVDDDTDYNLYINYIKKETNPTRFSAQFINALAWRIALELAIMRTENKAKISFCEAKYREALVGADSLNQSLDSLDYETGDDSWETAGR